MSTYERVTCPRCGRDVAARTPKGGDGSALKVYAHAATTPAGLRAGKGLCSGSGQLV